MRKKITMQDIADHLQLSKFAISKALSGKTGVGNETRERIIQAAIQLGYFSQAPTRKLHIGQSLGQGDEAVSPNDTVIIMMPNIRSQTEESSYWGAIIHGISEELKHHHLRMVILTEPSIDYLERIINPQALLGLICVGVVPNQYLLTVKNRGIPFVLVDHEDPLVRTDTIFMDNYECMRRVLQHLIEVGHTHPQFVGNPSFSPSFSARWLGFRSPLDDKRLEPQQNEELLAIDVNNTTKMTNQLSYILTSMYDQKKLPTAFVCANDEIAIIVMRELTRLGVRVPQECSITGFDNSSEGLQVSPALSTVHVAKEVMGRRAIEMLLRRIKHPDDPQEKLLLNGEFIIRQSVDYAMESNKVQISAL